MAACCWRRDPAPADIQQTVNGARKTEQADDQLEKVMENRTPSIIDLNTELAKLTMFRRSPHSTAADRKGSVARLASYRDGLFLAIKASGSKV